MLSHAILIAGEALCYVACVVVLLIVYLRETISGSAGHASKRSKIEKLGFMRKDTLDKIKDKTIYAGECFIFMGNSARNPIDSPYVRDGYRIVRVANYVYQRLVEPLVGDNIVCHKCDNPRCWNIKHLYQGTHGSNNRDKINRGRENINYGVVNGSCKISEELVVDIKIRLKRGGSPTVIAKKLGINRSTVYHISHGEAWEYLVV